MTINSDDPPMFNTTLTDEYLKVSEAFDLGIDAIERLVMNAVNATLLPRPQREAMAKEFENDFILLRIELNL